ncbi:Copia protein [Holothuria leucospilota]|uniref:Copia protein n=1 Tax=Holothuria leucospilota TaxID=206669 RepID=A0A9Q1HFP9_HOLLE|nr:Copia protein [Holothuria leucospilota]
MKTASSPDTRPKFNQNGNVRGTNEFKCFKCGKQGHYARNCNVRIKPDSNSSSIGNRWCSTCRSSTHNDSNCRRKNKARKDKISQVADNPDEESTFSFKASESRDIPVNVDPRSVLLVDCGATSHIVTDESKFESFDESFRPENHFVELADGSRSNRIALKRGDANVRIMDADGRCVIAKLENALYIPTFPQNLFSVQAATAKGSTVIFHPKYAEIIHKDGVRFSIEKYGRLYYLHMYENSKPLSDSVNYACDLKSWHEILGHCNYDDVLSLESVVNGMKVTNVNDKVSDCNTCFLGKMTQGRNREPDARSDIPLGLVHTDLAGPIEPVSKEGFKYAMAFTDDFSGAVFVYFLKSKRDVISATEKFLADSAPFGNVKRIRSDNGTEFTSYEFEKLLRKNKIRHETSAPYSPHQNGTAERNWRTLFEMGRCLLLQSELGKDMWPYAVLAATYIRNRCFNRR